MPTGTVANFQIYDDEFYAGMIETLQQNTDAFNAASQNAIRLVAGASEGHFQREAFFANIAGLVSRRDITSTAPVDDEALGSEELVRPKVNRRIGPISNTLDSLKKIASNEREFSTILGEQVGKAKAKDYLNTLITAGVAALSGVQSGGVTGTGLYYDGTAANLSISALIAGRRRFGDAFAQILAWVMHSKPFHDLVGEQAEIACDSVAGATIYEGSVGTLGRPTVVIDSPSLVNPDALETATVDSYNTLGLTADALAAIDSEEDTMVSELITGLENIAVRMQGEHAYNVGVQGFAYTDATANPTDAALGTAANWAARMDNVKSLAGVLIESR